MRNTLGGRARLLLVGVALVAVAGLTGCDGIYGPSTNLVENAIRLHFGAADAPAAYKIAKCESGLNPRAVSPGGGNHGLFQINNVHARAFTQYTGRPWADRYDPFTNSLYAAHLFHQQGWGPWACKRVL